MSKTTVWKVEIQGKEDGRWVDLSSEMVIAPTAELATSKVRRNWTTGGYKQSIRTKEVVLFAEAY